MRIVVGLVIGASVLCVLLGALRMMEPPRRKTSKRKRNVWFMDDI